LNEPCLSGCLRKLSSDVRFFIWTPVVSPRHFPSFNGSSPMMKPVQDTLSICDGRTGSPA
jgi:hypothetical protein